jgi:hypothetical protein
MRANVILALNTEGRYQEVEDAAAVAADGRYEGFLNYPEDSEAAVDVKAEAAIDDLKVPRWQMTVAVEPTGTGDVPLSDWFPADSITIPNQDRTPTALPVIGLTLKDDTETGRTLALPEVGQRIPTLGQRQATNRRSMASGDMGGRVPDAMPRSAGIRDAATVVAPSSSSDAGGLVQIKTVSTTTYTALSTDNNHLVRLTNSSFVTVTLPVSVPNGTLVHFLFLGSAGGQLVTDGSATVVGGGTVSGNAEVSCLVTSANTWNVRSVG